MRLCGLAARLAEELGLPAVCLSEDRAPQLSVALRVSRRATGLPIVACTRPVVESGWAALRRTPTSRLPAAPPSEPPARVRGRVCCSSVYGR